MVWRECPASARRQGMAEEAGFEPASPCGPVVFKTTAFSLSATPPQGGWALYAGFSRPRSAPQPRDSTYVGSRLPSVPFSVAVFDLRRGELPHPAPSAATLQRPPP